MISGTDIFYPIKSYCPLREVIKIVSSYWPKLVIQSGTNSLFYKQENILPQEMELFLYRDHNSFQLWEKYGHHHENENTMFHILLSNDCKNITIVSDNPNHSETKKILDDIFVKIS
jgi:hypothetical protein